MSGGKEVSGARSRSRRSSEHFCGITVAKRVEKPRRGRGPTVKERKAVMSTVARAQAWSQRNAKWEA